MRATPLALAQIEERSVEVAQCAKDEEDGIVCCGIVDSAGNVGDMDVVLCAGGDVDLVVAGAWWLGR